MSRGMGNAHRSTCRRNRLDHGGGHGRGMESHLARDADGKAGEE